MKYKIALTIAFISIIASIIFFSCNKSTSITLKPEKEEQTVYEELHKDINAYDAAFQATLPLETRFSWKQVWTTLKGGLRVVGADITGGLAGIKIGQELDSNTGSNTYEVSVGIVGAVAASAAKAIEEFGLDKDSKETKPEKPEKPESVQSFSVYETGSSVGKAHNEIMEKLFDMYDKEGLTRVSSERLHQDVLRLTKENLGKNLPKCNTYVLQQITFRTEEIKKEFANLTSAETIKFLRNCKYGKQEDLNLIADYLVKIQSIPDLEYRRQYVNGYAKIISKSNISEISKRVVLSGTSTAVNSLTLWESNH